MLLLLLLLGRRVRMPERVLLLAQGSWDGLWMWMIGALALLCEAAIKASHQRSEARSCSS